MRQLQVANNLFGSRVCGQALMSNRFKALIPTGQRKKQHKHDVELYFLASFSE